MQLDENILFIFMGTVSTARILMFTIFLGQIRRLVTGVVNSGFMMASTPVPPACRAPVDEPVAFQRLTAVSGLEGRQNDVVFCASRNDPKGNVVFFGGDVQVQI